MDQSSPETFSEDKDEQIACEIFFAWDGQQKPIPYTPLQYSDGPWRSHAADAYILGLKLDAKEFRKYALSQFVMNCALAEIEVWERIESKVPDLLPLRKFSNHWIAWNLECAGQDEYEGLKAAKLRHLVTIDTRDPRSYDIDHWYSTCGSDINARCNHDPIVREAASRAASQPVTPKVEDSGYDWEVKFNSNKDETSKPKPGPRRSTGRRPASNTSGTSGGAGKP